MASLAIYVCVRERKTPGRGGIGKDKGENHYNEWKRKWLSLVSEISIYQVKNSYHRFD